MNLRIITILISFLIPTFVSCKAQALDEQKLQTTIKINMDTINEYFSRKYDLKTGLEIYNYEPGKNAKTNPAVVKTGNGWTILIYPMMSGGAIYDEYSPSTDFQYVQKKFYPSGMLKQISYFYQSNLKIGIWKYYDEQGNLLKEVDEDKKFEKSKIKINDILKLLEKEGWINLKTGEGATSVAVKNNQIVIDMAKFNIMYTDNENGQPIWYAITKQYTLSIVYEINGVTGKIKKTEKQTYSEE